MELTAPDTSNRFFVGGHGDNIILMKPIPSKLNRSEALNLAAWLVALADEDGRFARLLEAVQNT